MAESVENTLLCYRLQSKTAKSALPYSPPGLPPCKEPDETETGTQYVAVLGVKIYDRLWFNLGRRATEILSRDKLCEFFVK
ncbi:MAG: hypothetical protein LUD51_08220 [Clostridia bacterium]|nr:hypothetical protein [Clostridia bacterium]